MLKLVLALYNDTCYIIYDVSSPFTSVKDDRLFFSDYCPSFITA